MDGKDSGDIYNSFMLITAGMVFGYLCFAVSEHNMALIIILCNALIVFFIYFAINGKYKKKTSAFVKQLIENVEKISHDEKATCADGALFSAEAEAVYKTIGELKSTLKAQNETYNAVINIINSFAHNIELERLLSDILPKITNGTGCNWGAFYLNNSRTEKMELKCSVGFSKNIYDEFDIPMGEGFIGSFSATDEIKVLKDIPDDTVYITKTFLGKIKPKSIMVVPVTCENENVACLVLASVYNFTEPQVEVVNLMRYYLGSAVSNGVAYEKTKRLKNELVFQNQLIQNMNEELEQKVERRTDFLNAVLDSIVDYAIISMDADGFITMWNKGAELIKGYKASDVIGKHISYTYVEKERSESKRQLEMVKEDGKYEEHSVITRKDGVALHGHIVINAVYNNIGHIIGFTSITRDITVIKNLEKSVSYFSFLVDSYLNDTRDMLIFLDHSGYILNISEKAANMLGIRSDKIIGLLFDNMIYNKAQFGLAFRSALNELSEIELSDIALKNGGSMKTLYVSGKLVPSSLEKFAVIKVE